MSVICWVARQSPLSELYLVGDKSVSFNYLAFPVFQSTQKIQIGVNRRNKRELGQVDSLLTVQLISNCNWNNFYSTNLICFVTIRTVQLITRQFIPKKVFVPWHFVLANRFVPCHFILVSSLWWKQSIKLRGSLAVTRIIRMTEKS